MVKALEVVAGQRRAFFGGIGLGVPLQCTLQCVSLMPSTLASQKTSQLIRLGIDDRGELVYKDDEAIRRERVIWVMHVSQTTGLTGM